MSICKRCGVPHDDGTAEYCFDCLEEFLNEECFSDKDPEGSPHSDEYLSMIFSETINFI